MEDKQIIDLFFARNEDAIQHTADTYGNRLFVLADNIVRNDQDAEESVSDTYFILRPMSASIICDLEDVAPDFLTVGDRCVYVVLKDVSKVAFQGNNAGSGVQNLQAESRIELCQVAAVLMPDGTKLQVPEE